MEWPIQERAKFDLIRYSNCWEDADILLKALQVKEGGIYFSIASSGDNTLSILSQSPLFVLAIDINSAQLACVELKKAAFLNLTYEETLHFLGVQNGVDRISTYRKIRKHLSANAQQFWDGNQEIIKRGVIHVGKFENYFRLFRKWALTLVHPQERAIELLIRKEDRERFRFYNQKWDTWRWRLLFKIFFSRPVMGHLGRDPEFFKYVKGDVASRIMERVKYGLTALPTNENPYLEYILTGNFKNSLPFYLRRESFDIIQKNLEKLVLFKGDLDTAFRAYSTLRFDGFNLSDIFEYMSHEQYTYELQKILGFSKKEARLVYWNMLVDRKRPEKMKDRLKPLERKARELFLQDKAFFYKSLIVEEVTG
jgi:S-adenosylmethionine-diacylglycerol 3-amino-3-carboxypropyl transferase